jgi:hypothetical protein
MLGTYTSLSELEAANIMLSTISVAPVSTLEVPGDLNVSVAKQILYNTAREVESYGYYFNTDAKYPLARDTNDEIILPRNVLFVSVDRDFWSYDATLRGLKLYNRSEQTYKFDKDLTGSVTFFLEWDDLPQPARQYIAIKAARKFQLRMLPDEYTSKYSQQEELEAKAQLEDYDAMERQYNLADSNPVFNILAR